MTLADVIYMMVQENENAGQPTELRVGTVTSTAPLEIAVNVATAPLRAGQLYLTEPVVEKKIPGDRTCMEHGVPVPPSEGYTILNRGLAVGDKVLLLRVMHGQRFVVLSRVFEEV